MKLIRAFILIPVGVVMLVLFLFCCFMEWITGLEAERDIAGDVSGFRKK